MHIFDSLVDRAIFDLFHIAQAIYSSALNPFDNLLMKQNKNRRILQAFLNSAETCFDDPVIRNNYKEKVVLLFRSLDSSPPDKMDFLVASTQVEHYLEGIADKKSFKELLKMLEEYIL